MNKKLISEIRKYALLEGDFILSSGEKSNYYLDKYLFECNPDILLEVVGLLFDKTKGYHITKLAGVELGGVVLASVMSVIFHIPFIIVRKEKKTYGTKKFYEGTLDSNDGLILLEDVVTTGFQVVRAADLLTEAGVKPLKILAVIDREEGGKELLERAGFDFESLITKTDLL